MVSDEEDTVSLHIQHPMQILPVPTLKRIRNGDISIIAHKLIKVVMCQPSLIFNVRQ
jgi:hypothetical protein